MSEKAILVTGGAGYIGSHACKALAQSGFEPIAYDNLSQGHEWAVKWGPFEKGDIQDPERLSQVLKKYRPSAAIHFAAHLSVGESVAEPAKYFQNNVSGAITLLNALNTHGIKTFIFSSTAAIFGVPQEMPIPETHPKEPINPYGLSKLMIERVLEEYDRAYQFKSVALRYFNASGADPDSEIGEDHDPEIHLIPLTLQAAEPGGAPLKIFGKDYPTPDGSCIRDYIHVTDLAEAHVLALKFLIEKNKSDRFNLGTGKGASVFEVIQTAERVLGKKVRSEVSIRRPGDPPSLVASAAKAKRELGWNPRHSSLETIIKTASNWLSKSSARKS